MPGCSDFPPRERQILRRGQCSNTDRARVEEECDDNEGRQQTRDLFTAARSMTKSFECNLILVSGIGGEGRGWVSLYLSRGGKLLVRIILLKVPSPRGQIVHPKY